MHFTTEYNVILLIFRLENISLDSGFWIRIHVITLFCKPRDCLNFKRTKPTAFIRKLCSNVAVSPVHARLEVELLQELLHSILCYYLYTVYIYIWQYFLETSLCSWVTVKGPTGHLWPAGHRLGTPAQCDHIYDIPSILCMTGVL